MKRRTTILAAVLVTAAAAALAGATFALGGGTFIWDDGRLAKPGSLDDGKQLLPLTSVTLAHANAIAQHATTGALGQVDLERYNGIVVYKVDVGDKEVRVDATGGTIVSVEPQT